MTWAELRQAVDAAGIRDEDTIEVFDREMFNELVQLYRVLDTDQHPDVVADCADWVDALRDRYTLPNPDGCWLDGIGFPYSYGDGRVAVVRADYSEDSGREGIVKIFFSSVMTFERPERYLETNL